MGLGSGKGKRVDKISPQKYKTMNISATYFLLMHGLNLPYISLLDVGIRKGVSH